MYGDTLQSIDELDQENREPLTRSLLHYTGEKINDYSLVQYDWLNFNLHNIKRWAHSSLDLLEAQGSFYQLYVADFSLVEVMIKIML